MTAFDKFLDFLVPLLVIIGMLWILYKPFKKPLDALGGWIKRMSSGEEEAEQLEGEYHIPTVRDNLDFQ